jgi:hypothetical protein
MAIWRRVACWINQATQAPAHARARVRAHTEMSDFLLFLRQQWFRASVSMLHYTYIASLVCS